MLDLFVFSTSRVSMLDGKKKEISKIVAGDYVIGINKRGKIVDNLVKSVYSSGETHEWQKIVYSRTGLGITICTKQFLIYSNGDFRRAGGLDISDKVKAITFDKQTFERKILDIDTTYEVPNHEENVGYNLFTEYDTYFVNDILVRNMPDDNIPF